MGSGGGKAEWDRQPFGCILTSLGSIHVATGDDASGIESFKLAWCMLSADEK